MGPKALIEGHWTPEDILGRGILLNLNSRIYSVSLGSLGLLTAYVLWVTL